MMAAQVGSIAHSPASVDYKTLLGLKFAPSKFQERIFDWIRYGHGNAVVDACAGSGKTTTSVLASKLMDGEGLYCAFNKPIADELEERLVGTKMKAATVHRHGLACLRFYAYARIGLNGRVQVKVDDQETKYADMFAKAGEAVLDRAIEIAPDPNADLGEQVSSLCGEPVTREQLALIEDPSIGFPVGECVDLARLCRLFLVDFDAPTFDRELAELADRYDVEVDPVLWPLVVTAVCNALCLGCEVPEEGEWLVDFTDMLWLPNVLGLRPKQYDWVMVDECQDISTAARRLLMASVKRGGRMLWVGDPAQSINGFAGADSESFAAIIRESRATVLPLSVCYRCPTSHLEIARQWKPEIEARPGAPVGTVTRMERSEYVDVAKRGDLVICRRTAPLVELCFELIAAGISANVRGRADMSKGLLKIVKRASKLSPRGDGWRSTFEAGLAAFKVAETEKIKKRGRNEQSTANSIDALGDRIECVRIVWRSSGATDARELAAAIERIFADKDAAISLSTIHRAKGLEADRVVILEYDRIMSLRARQKWQIDQEEHAAYVAWTRAKEDLILIPAPKRGEA